MPKQRPSSGRLLAVSVILAVGLATGGCSLLSSKDTVTIGYMGGLTGRASSLGLEGRDGAQLAVELANASSKDSVTFSLLEADDSADSVTAVNQLADGDAVAIVGPMTSASALAAAPVANDLGIVLLSPTVSTDQLSRVDDQFLRVYPSNESAAQELAHQVIARFPEANVAVIYDFGNRAHTETWLDHFKTSLSAQGGLVSTESTFTSGQNPDYSTLAAAAIKSDSGCIFILANAIDTAMLCQRIRAAGSDATILATEWSSTDDLIETGGRTVDDMLFIQTYDRLSTNAEYVEFSGAFRERFGYAPGFAGLHAYDATRMIINAVSHGATRGTVKTFLLESATFPGAQAPITLNGYGDTEPVYFLTTIKSGIFAQVSAQ